MRVLLILLTGLFVSAALWAQEQQSAEESSEPVAAAEAEEVAEDPLADLDETGYDDEDEDDFVPTEEIPYDQDIPFPTDI